MRKTNKKPTDKHRRAKLLLNHKYKQFLKMENLKDTEDNFKDFMRIYYGWTREA